MSEHRSAGLTGTSGSGDPTGCSGSGGSRAALPGGYALRSAHLRELDGLTWEAIARLRQDVFIVEQECAYADLDGRDREAGTLQLWASAPDGSVASTLRVLHEDGGEARRIGRVATAVGHRGAGLASAMMRAGVAACEGLRIELEAQAHLQGWYEGLGFTRVGAEFLEDGIPHVPMRREAAG